MCFIFNKNINSLINGLRIWQRRRRPVSCGQNSNRSGGVLGRPTVGPGVRPRLPSPAAARLGSAQRGAGGEVVLVYSVLSACSKDIDQLGLEAWIFVPGDRIGGGQHPVEYLIAELTFNLGDFGVAREIGRLAWVFQPIV